MPKTARSLISVWNDEENQYSLPRQHRETQSLTAKKQVLTVVVNSRLLTIHSLKSGPQFSELPAESLDIELNI